MSIPETEILNRLASRVFSIQDATLGDAQKGHVVRYRGRLLTEDSAAAYDQLADSVKGYNLTPLFREENGQHVIYLVHSLPAPKPNNVNVNILLFVLTVVSVMLAGAQPEGPIPSDVWGQILLLVKSIFSGWPFALSLLGILLAHEFGHYLVSRYHKTPATLPYFLPLPFSPLGTLGAFIRMQGIPKNKRTLFDIGVAGPLAGMAIAVPILFLGLSLSSLDTISAEPGQFLEGNSIFYLFAKFLVFGKMLPAPVTTGSLPPVLYWISYFFTGRPFPIGGTDVFIHPVAFAGWAGLLVTAMNLVPVGTLDGGHVIYALFGNKARQAYPFVLGALIVLGFVWSGWWTWAFLLFWLGRVHAEPLDQITSLDPPRRAVAVLAIVLFILVFTPVPMVLLG